MITLIDYIKTHKAKAAAEGALLLLGISGAIWLIATRGWSHITTNTIQESKDKFDLELTLNSSITGAEGAESGNVDKDISKSIEESTGEKSFLRTSYTYGIHDLIPTRKLNEREIAMWLKAKKDNPDVKLPSMEIVGKTQCQALAIRRGVQWVLDEGICEYDKSREKQTQYENSDTEFLKKTNS